MQNGAAAGGDRIANLGGTTIGLDGRLKVKPMRRMESGSTEHLESFLNPPSPPRLQASTSSRSDGSGAVLIQSEKWETQVKQTKDARLFDYTKAKFSVWKQSFLCLAKLHGPCGISTEGINVPVADETMPIAALQEALPR